MTTSMLPLARPIIYLAVVATTGPTLHGHPDCPICPTWDRFGHGQVERIILGIGGRAASCCGGRAPEHISYGEHGFERRCRSGDRGGECLQQCTDLARHGHGHIRVVLNLPQQNDGRDAGFARRGADERAVIELLELGSFRPFVRSAARVVGSPVSTGTAASTFWAAVCIAGPWVGVSGVLGAQLPLRQRCTEVLVVTRPAWLRAVVTVRTVGLIPALSIESHTRLPSAGVAWVIIIALCPLAPA